MSEDIRKSKKHLTPHQNHFLKLAGVFVVVVILCIVVLVVQSTMSHVKIDKATVRGDVVSVSTATSGILNEVFVHVGDLVPANTVIARVDQMLIHTDIGGLVTSVQENIGTRYNPGQTIATVVDPHTVRIVGQLDENKGLKEVHVGQQATFTVDAFGSKTFQGMIDEVSPTSRDSGIVFNISDKRETKTFNIFVRFDVEMYPELKQGMSARVLISK